MKKIIYIGLILILLSSCTYIFGLRNQTDNTTSDLPEKPTINIINKIIPDEPEIIYKNNQTETGTTIGNV